MLKLLTAVIFLSASLFVNQANAGETKEKFDLSTKSLVRMSLWYQGLQSSEELMENQEVREAKLSEELEKALVDA